MTTHTHYNQYRRHYKFGAFTLLCIAGLTFGYIYRDSNKNIIDIPKDSTKPVINKPEPYVKPYISILPNKIQQGDPVFMTLEGDATRESVKSFTFNGLPLIVFNHDNKASAILGVQLSATPGTYPLVLTFNDGSQLKKDLVILEKEVVIRPFDIPEKLGGNTLAGERELVASLAVEGKIINALPVVREKLWTEKFGLPLKGPLVIADDYGYTRIVGKYTTMPHKGTDIVAEMGTQVFAMNRGIVKYVGSLRNYGNTVVVDHGVGLQTVYMHLSEINVVLDQEVSKGQPIALSGDSGYTLDPHLHLTVRIWDIAVDPMKFLEIFGE